MNPEVPGMQRITRKVNYEKASKREDGNTRVHWRQGGREDTSAVKHRTWSPGKTEKFEDEKNSGEEGEGPKSECREIRESRCSASAQAYPDWSSWALVLGCLYF